MTYKWFGAILVLAACGGWGLCLGARQKGEERLLEELQQILSHMECELRYRLTPLPELCRQVGRGPLREIFRELGEKLDSNAAPEAAGCMRAVLRDHRELPAGIRRLLNQLGRSLGRFDLPGQLEGLGALREACRREEGRLADYRRERLRSCRTLAFCAGAALVIIFA